MFSVIFWNNISIVTIIEVLLWLKFEAREKQRVNDLVRRLENKHKQQLEDLQAAADVRLKELEQIQVTQC